MRIGVRPGCKSIHQAKWFLESQWGSGKGRWKVKDFTSLHHLLDTELDVSGSDESVCLVMEGGDQKVDAESQRR